VVQVFVFKICDFLKLFSTKSIGSKYSCKHGHSWRNPLVFFYLTLQNVKMISFHNTVRGFGV